VSALTRKQFRTAALVGAGFWALGATLELGHLIPLSEDEKILVEWNYQRAILPHGLIVGIYWYSMLGYLAGLIGFVLFKGWGRSLLLFSEVLGMLSSPFLGWIICMPLAAGITWLGGSILLGLLALSYFEPHSEFFEDRKQRSGDSAEE
jgi:hypothetical protein